MVSARSRLTAPLRSSDTRGDAAERTTAPEDDSSEAAFRDRDVVGVYPPIEQNCSVWWGRDSNLATSRVFSS